MGTGREFALSHLSRCAGGTEGGGVSGGTISIDRSPLNLTNHRSTCHRHRLSLSSSAFLSAANSLFPLSRARARSGSRARSRASSALGASGGAGPAERSHDQCRRQLGAGTRLADSSGSTQTEGPRRGKLHHKRARPHHTTVRLANKGVKNWLKNLDEKRGTNSTLLCLLLLFELQLDCN